MSIHNDFVVHICECTGDSARVVRQELRPARLTLAMANAHGFETIDEYEEAIREYVYGWVTKSRLPAAFTFSALWFNTDEFAYQVYDLVQEDCWAWRFVGSYALCKA